MITFEDYIKLNGTSYLLEHHPDQRSCYENLFGKASEVGIGFWLHVRLGYTRWEEIRLWQPGNLLLHSVTNKRTDGCLDAKKTVRCNTCNQKKCVFVVRPRTMFYNLRKRHSQVTTTLYGEYSSSPYYFSLNTEELARFNAAMIETRGAGSTTECCNDCRKSAGGALSKISALNKKIKELTQERNALKQSLKAGGSNLVSKQTIKFFQLNHAVEQIKKHNDNSN